MIGAFIDDEKSRQDQKNSKILNRKQIQKRLQGLKLQEHEQIAKNLKNQNLKLKNQVQTLSQKVQELIQSRKMQKISKSPQVEEEIMKHKKQLDLKYMSMNYLKEQVKKQGQLETTQEMQMKVNENKNHLHRTDIEIKEFQSEKNKLKVSIAFHEENLKEYLPDNETSQKIETIRIQNKQLKHKVHGINSTLKDQEKNSQNTINKIYSLKSEQKKKSNHSSISIKEGKEIAITLQEIKSTSVNEIDILEKEIQDLKKKKQHVEKDLVTDKIIREAKKNKMEEKIREGLELHKEMYKRKLKFLNQLNLYERKEIELRAVLEKEEIRNSIVYEEKNNQTQPIIEKKQFRKDWIGKAEGLTFNDSDVLEHKGESMIKAVTVYKTAENLVFLKFHYDSPSQKKKYESMCPLDKAALKKCEAKRIESKNVSHLKGLIASTANKKINRVEFLWGDGDSSVVGWETQGSVKFVFDIDQSERIVCMFGSVSTSDKGLFVLESLGCEINKLE